VSLLFGGDEGRGWTIATLVIAGIVLALAISYIVNLITYGVSLILNTTAWFHGVAMTSLGYPENAQTIQVGNYTAEIPVPNNSVLQRMESEALPIGLGILRIVSNTTLFAIAIVITLIIAALTMRVRG